MIEKQLQKYDQLKGYIDLNLVAQDNIIKALTEANVQCATIRKTLSVAQEQYVYLHFICATENEDPQMYVVDV